MSILLMPPEILYEILQYLTLSDRKAVALTCRSLHASYIDSCDCRSQLTTVNVTSTDNVTDVFEALKYAHQLCIRRMRFDSSSFQREQLLNSNWDTFWKNVGFGICELVFQECDISERTFSKILLELCPQLESLSLVTCNSLFMSGKLLDGFCPIRTGTLNTILRLILIDNRYLSDALFNRLTSFMPNITTLSLSRCQISFHPAIYKRFYPPNTPPSESVLTFQNVFKFLESKRLKIVSLDFSNTMIDDNALQQLCDLEGMQLEELFLENCQEVSIVGIEAICTRQRYNLRRLSLSGNNRLTDGAMLLITDCLGQLTCLNVSMCRKLTTVGIEELNKLTRLSSLQLSGCELLDSAGVEKSLWGDGVHMKLVELNLASCDLTVETVVNLSKACVSLRSLDLSNCRRGVTDVSLRAICENLQWLTCLKLAWCLNITDACLTGSLQDESNYERRPARLSDIRGLRTLDLCGCTGITDTGFREIRFKELTHLDVSLCHKITDVGFINLRRRWNGSLEKLVISQCRDITDVGMIALVNCLPRLKYLDLQGCKKIGQSTLDALQLRCPELRFLDVSVCPLITQEVVDKLEYALPRLHINKRPMQLTNGLNP